MTKPNKAEVETMRAIETSVSTLEHALKNCEGHSPAALLALTTAVGILVNTAKIPEAITLAYVHKGLDYGKIGAKALNDAVFSEDITNTDGWTQR